MQLLLSGAQLATGAPALGGIAPTMPQLWDGGATTTGQTEVTQPGLVTGAPTQRHSQVDLKIGEYTSIEQAVDAFWKDPYVQWAVVNDISALTNAQIQYLIDYGYLEESSY